MSSVCRWKRMAGFAFVTLCLIFSCDGYGLMGFCIDTREKAKVGNVYPCGGGYEMVIVQVIPNENGILVGLEKNFRRNCPNNAFIFVRTMRQGFKDGDPMFSGRFRCIPPFSYIDVNGGVRTVQAFEQLNEAEVEELVAKEKAEQKRVSEERERKEITEQPTRKEYAGRAISGLDLVLERNVYVDRNRTDDIMLSVKHFLWKDLVKAKQSQDWLQFLNIADDIVEGRSTRTTAYQERFPDAEKVDKILYALSNYRFRFSLNIPTDCRAIRLNQSWLQFKEFCTGKAESIDGSSFAPFGRTKDYTADDDTTLALDGPPLFVLPWQFMTERIPPDYYFIRPSERPKGKADYFVVDVSKKYKQVRAHEISGEEFMLWAKTEFERIQKVIDDKFVPMNSISKINYSQTIDSQESLQEYARQVFSKLSFDGNRNLLVEKEYLNCLQFTICTAGIKELETLRNSGNWFEFIEAAQRVCATLCKRPQGEDYYRELGSRFRDLSDGLTDDGRISKFPERPAIASLADCLGDLAYCISITQKSKAPFMQANGISAGWNTFRTNYAEYPCNVLWSPASPEYVSETRAADVRVYPNHKEAIVAICTLETMNRINKKYWSIKLLTKKMNSNALSESDARRQFEVGCAEIEKEILEKFVFLSGGSLNAKDKKPAAASAQQSKQVEKHDSKSEVEAAIAGYKRIVSDGPLAMLPIPGYGSGHSRIKEMSLKMQTQEGKKKVEDLKYRIVLTGIMHRIFVREVPGYTFKKSKLKGHRVVDADAQKMCVYFNGELSNVEWKDLYTTHRGNLNELINRYIVEGRKTCKKPLQEKDWVNAVCGTAIILRIIGDDNPSALARSKQLIAMIVKQYPDKVNRLFDDDFKGK